MIQSIIDVILNVKHVPIIIFVLNAIWKVVMKETKMELNVKKNQLIKHHLLNLKIKYLII